MSMDADAPANLSCELVTRHWKIIDGEDQVEEVNGPGVVGGSSKIFIFCKSSTKWLIKWQTV